MKDVIPTPSALMREALTVVGGAIIAGIIIGNLPALREWLKRQWGAPPPPG